MKMTLTQFIKANNLRPADAVEMVCPTAGFPRHYAVYLGHRNGIPQFIANITDGIQILTSEKLVDFIQRYHVTNIEKFSGNQYQRRMAIQRAMNRIGERAYNLIFNNCEHFKNWVLHERDESHQVATFGKAIAVAGASAYLIGWTSDNKGLKKAGAVILASLFIIIILALILLNQSRPNQEHSDNFSV